MEGDAIDLADLQVLRDLWVARYGTQAAYFVLDETRQKRLERTWYAIAKRLHATGYAKRRVFGRFATYQLLGVV
jgi:hypothetical protein